MAISDLILKTNFSKVSGLDSKSSDYINSIQVWVLGLTNIRRQARGGNPHGLNSLVFKGGYISSASFQGGHISWPWLQATGWKGTAYRSTGDAYPLMDLQKVHEGSRVPYNVKVSLTPKILGSLFPPESRDQVSNMAGAFPSLEEFLGDVGATQGDIQLHLTVGMSPETYADSEVKEMYSKDSRASRVAWEVQLAEQDILGVDWVLPGHPTFVPGLHLGQIVNLVEEQVLHPEEHPPDVLQPSEVLPKDAQVVRYLNKNYGPFLQGKGLDPGEESTQDLFLLTLTGAFLKWVEIPENKEKALGALKKWKPQGSEGKVRSMGKKEKVNEEVNEEVKEEVKGGGMGNLPPVSSSSKKEDEFAF